MKPDFQEPVNINIQTILIFIPFIWLYALSRIKKLGRGVLIFIPLSLASPVFVTFVISLGEMIGDIEVFLLVYLGGMVIFIICIIIQIKLIRKWSREWNKQFKTASQDVSQHK